MTTGEKFKSQLSELSRNLWWAWTPHIIKLFRDLDPEAFRAANHNPVSVLAGFSGDRFEDLARDATLRTRVDSAFRELRDYLGAARTWGSVHAGPLRVRPVAYFSAEFGVHESLPIYSGGLGVLAGDHLKSASELPLPLVGRGLVYRNGYFQQYLSADGWQQEAYPELDFYNLAVEEMKYTDGTPIQIRVDFPDNAVFAKVWKAQIGRIPLYLLDTNVADNAPADREITSRLYGGGTEMRIKQEIVLGIGGVRALDALGIAPTIFHMNEGHAAFLALERTRVLLENSSMTFDEARQQVASTNVFTTHT